MADFGKLNFAVAFNPQTAFPLDARTLFYSYEEAAAAARTAERAGSTNTVYYWGMRLTVVDEKAQTARQYIIQPTGRLVGVAHGSDGGSSGGGDILNPDSLGDSLVISPETGKVEVNVSNTVTADGSLPVTGAAVAEYVDDAIESSLGIIEDIIDDI
jgi:hypothetical protein